MRQLLHLAGTGLHRPLCPVMLHAAGLPMRPSLHALCGLDACSTGCQFWQSCSTSHRTQPVHGSSTCSTLLAASH